MKIFTNKNVRNIFILLFCVSGGLLAIAQFLLWLSYRELKLANLFLSLLVVISILGICFLYFQKQDKIIEDAISQIQSYLKGDTDLRIASDEEGSLYKLFHTVNTLAALNIYNALMQDETEDIAAMREFAVKSEQELDRIETLVQNLLKITRLDSGSILIERTRKSIAELFYDIRQHFEFRMKAERKTIVLSGEENAVIFCDGDWMTEALSNLVKNALDHMEGGGQIDINWKQLPSITQITIKDNGCGIHLEDIHHIFKRFYRSRFSKDTQGLGLGLPLAKSIVEAHDGTITVDSTFGKGSIFSISFLNLTKL